MSRTLTEYLSKKKSFDQEKRDRVMQLLRENWRYWHVDMVSKRIRTELLKMFGKRDKVEKVERLFAREFAKFDRVFNSWRLMDDPGWVTAEQLLKKIDEEKRCPFCESKLRLFLAVAEREDVMKCDKCNKVYHLK